MSKHLCIESWQCLNDPLFQDAKAAEAAQSAYYDPNRPQMAFVPPPAYYENPPSYSQATSKKDQ
jgi:hypothetical protein